MLRVVERVMGEGPAHRDGRELFRVGYELTVYRNWTSSNGTLEPGHFEVEGHLMASPEQLDGALGVSSPITLHLDDGRRFDFYVVNTEGVVTGADERGLY